MSCAPAKRKNSRALRREKGGHTHSRDTRADVACDAGSWAPARRRSRASVIGTFAGAPFRAAEQLVSAAAQNDMHVNASNTATIICGGDTKIVGATSTQKGERQYRGDPNSRPCRIPAAAHPTVPVAGSALARPTVARLSAMQSGNYARVSAQAVPRHNGGFGITVKGNTDLKGAHTASTATPAKDQLMTGTLSFSDIQNSASSFAINARGGVGVGDGGDNSASPGQTRGNNTMGC
ncbi:filamentous hemagglutinin family outer membrane protein [Burkholderia multivorans]|uniref:Filamentous hemagglutinin family outer membrane protein n=2 Tax=Burkholderia multivorans TaxID=87883 RepID=A0ABD7LRZ4_9BURK|nr:filamentous hemagglutinin family outer membrane protein [Burkholderia multivorans]SAK23212.1 filamentous hemagglutinin family outer membrane protein [Burkholderia multivorans]